MTYLTITHVTGGDRAGYDSINDNLPTTEPEGLLARYAGQSADAFVITGVWASKAHWDRFATEQLGPAVGRAGLADGATAHTVEFDASDEFVLARSGRAN
jgi:hypothetical protein